MTLASKIGLGIRRARDDDFSLFVCLWRLSRYALVTRSFAIWPSLHIGALGFGRIVCATSWPIRSFGWTWDPVVFSKLLFETGRADVSVRGEWQRGMPSAGIALS